MRPRRAIPLHPGSVGLRIRKPGLPGPAAECFEFSSFSPRRAARVLMPASIHATLSIESASPYPFPGGAGRGCGRVAAPMAERAESEFATAGISWLSSKREGATDENHRHEPRDERAYSGMGRICRQQDVLRA